MTEDILVGGPLAYDGPFWRDRLSTDRAQAIVDSGIPVLLWSGWQDHGEGAVRTYTALQNLHAGRPAGAPMDPGQPVTPRYQLIMGDWPHARGLDVGVYLDWIDTWMSGRDTGFERTATPMHLFEVGTDRWVNLDRFPAVARSTPWYLASDGAMSQSPSEAGEDTLVRREPSEPGATLRYETPPLGEGATISGPIDATITASSTNTNMQLIARLFDVAPDGTTAEISMGSALGSQRGLDESMTWRDESGGVTWSWPRLTGDEYLQPGRPYQINVSLLSRQWGIQPGHRLRLELSGQSPPAICDAGDRSAAPRTWRMFPCELLGAQRQTIPGATYTIFYGGEQGSMIDLPLLPFRTFASVPSAIRETGYSESGRTVGGGEFALPTEW
jgi:uncharacterized protein